MLYSIYSLFLSHSVHHTCLPVPHLGPMLRGKFSISVIAWNLLFENSTFSPNYTIFTNFVKISITIFVSRIAIAQMLKLQYFSYMRIFCQFPLFSLLTWESFYKHTDVLSLLTSLSNFVPLTNIDKRYCSSTWTSPKKDTCFCLAYILVVRGRC